MAGLIELLERFNRKERFFLIGQALGNEDFRLSEDFRRKLGCEIGVEIPCDAFAAMDYHLDAVAGSLWKYRNPEHQMTKDFPKRDRMVTGTQQDIDLLIAFKEKDSDVRHLVFLEAKGYESNNSDGYTRWDTKDIYDQMQKKASQLGSIFGPDKRNSPKVIPHFCLMSHSPSENLATDNWPEWMRKEESAQPHWIELCLPSDRLLVTRCHPSGESSMEGERFRIVRQYEAEGITDSRYERNKPGRTTKAGKRDRRYSVNR